MLCTLVLGKDKKCLQETSKGGVCCVSAESFTSSNRQQRRPDDRKNSASSVVIPAVDDWQRNEDAALRQSRRLERSASRLSTVQIAMSDDAEFVLDALRCVEPVKFRVCQLRQAAVKVLGATDWPHGLLRSTLVAACTWLSLEPPGETDVAIVDLGRHKDVHRREQNCDYFHFSKCVGNGVLTRE